MCCKENLENLGKKLDVNTFTLTVIRLMLPSVLFLILGFFGFLHSWMNLWAEITRFPDRAFYSDWWNSIEFGSYYRKWNIVVHDFLYCYIYLDFRRFFPICMKYKVLSQLATFLISAAIHEAIICLALGYFYPILFILFTGPGILLIQNQKRLKKISVNFMFWLEMYIGTALLFSFYLVESFARQKVNDEIVEADFKSLSFLIPRTIYLGRIWYFPF